MRRRSTVGTLGAIAIGMLTLATVARAQMPAGPTTTPSGSYLNLQPRRQMRQPPPVAPTLRPSADEPYARRESRQVVCGMTVITPPPGTDDAMVVPVPKDGPRPTMRTIDPPICNPAR